MIIFLNIHKDKMLRGGKKRNKMYIKCSQYIGTNKTSFQCLKRINYKYREYNK